MARITRFSAQQPVPVEQAQLIDPSGFRPSGVSAQVLGDIGNVLQELGERKQAAEDSLSVNTIRESRDLAELQMKQFMIDNPNPSTWAEGAFNIIAAQRKVFSEQKMSPDVRDNELVEQEAFGNELGARVEILSTTAIIDQDITVSGKNLITTTANDDGTKDAAMRQIEAQNTYQQALERKYPKDVADIHMEETLREAIRSFYIIQSKLRPDEIIEEMEKKKKALGKSGIGEDGLSAKDYDDIIGQAESALARANRNLNRRYAEGERENHSKFIAGELTIEENDRAFNAGEINVQTHKAYDSIIKNKDLLDSDTILAGKWLDNTLTMDDIKQAQKEGRLANSNVVASWVSRINREQFNAGIYDAALVRIREVQFDKNKYNEVRTWLLDNADALGSQWDDVRNRLETAANAKGDAAGPHIQRAHKLIDAFIKATPEINDGTLESIRTVQRIHDAVDARADQTPEQIRNLTEALLLPYREEKAKGFFNWVINTATALGPVPILLRGGAKVRAKKRRIFQSMIMIQPVSKDEFKSKVVSLKSLFGDNSREAKQFYDKYVDGYDWGIE